MSANVPRAALLVVLVRLVDLEKFVSVWGMEPWEVVSPASDPVLRAGPYLRLFPAVQWTALRGSHPLWRRVPNAFASLTKQTTCDGPPITGKACNPATARRWCLARSRFRRAPVRSPLLRGYCLFLGLREMFQLARYPHHTRWCPRHKDVEVALLGNRRITARYLQDNNIITDRVSASCT
jgi:hypothetical protein